MAHVITEPCVGSKDAGCVDACPVSCIYGKNKDWLQLYIHPSECLDCGACVPVCPVLAIFAESEVWRSATRVVLVSAVPFVASLVWGNARMKSND